MKKAMLFITLPLWLCATNALAQRCNSLADLHWLIGEWKANSNGKIVTETWDETSEITMEGLGMTLSPQDGSTKVETLRLLQMKEDIFYIAKVEENQMPVPFQLVRCLPNAAVFQNPQHDFPKQIVYQMTSDKDLKVTVSDGASKGFVLDFVRQ